MPARKTSTHNEKRQEALRLLARLIAAEVRRSAEQKVAETGRDRSQSTAQEGAA